MENLKRGMQNLLEKVISDKFCLFFLVLTIALIVFGVISFIRIGILQKIPFFLFGIWSLMFLFLSLKFTIKKCNIKVDKKFYIYSAVILVICFLIYIGIMLNTRQIYTWDQTCYYDNQMNLLESFDARFARGIKDIIKTTYTSDYGYFLLSFTTLIFSFTNKTTTAFILTFVFTEILPVMFVLLLNVLNICNKFKVKDKKIFVILASIVLLVFPLLHKAALTGQPDIFGLFWVGLIMLLTTNYKFEEKDIGRWSLIIVFSFLLAITRRWYIFWMIGYYVSYGVFLLIEAILDKNRELLIKKLKNALTFAGIAVLILGVLLFPIIYKTIVANYSVSYSDWNLGGLSLEIWQQYKFLGIISIILIISGIIYWTTKKESRYFIFTNVLTYIITIILFTRIQNTWYHQSLMFVLQYLMLIILGIGAICQVNNKYVRNVLVTVILLYLATSEYGAFTENKMFFDNSLYSNISIKPEYREDYDKIGEMVQFIEENCEEGKDTVYPNFATSKYCSQTFSRYGVPNAPLKNIMDFESSIDSVHGFPTAVFSAKYVILANQVLNATGATSSKTIPDINEAILNMDGIKNKFKKVKEFDMGDGVILALYERVEKIDKEEIDIWKEIVEEQSSKYQDIFEKRIESYIK